MIVTNVTLVGGTCTCTIESIYLLSALYLDNQDYLMERIQSLQDLLAMEQELSQKVYLELEAEQGSHQQRKRELEAERTAHQETMLEFEAEKRMSLNMKFQVDKLMEESEHGYRITQLIKKVCSYGYVTQSLIQGGIH